MPPSHNLCQAPGLYRARPVMIQAIPYTTPQWPRLRFWLDNELGRHHYSRQDDELIIETFEGDHRGCLIDTGYMIVRGTIGEFYPVCDQAFQSKYELSGPGAYQPRHAAGGAA
jgi:hypothetical protein